jgi:hypothetical protein
MEKILAGLSGCIFLVKNPAITDEAFLKLVGGGIEPPTHGFSDESN